MNNKAVSNNSKTTSQHDKCKETQEQQIRVQLFWLWRHVSHNIETKEQQSCNNKSFIMSNKLIDYLNLNTCYFRWLPILRILNTRPPLSESFHDL